VSSLYGLFNTGQSALQAQQQGISVVGHNIANVNTPGYSRQRLVLDPNEPISSKPGMLGTGVDVAEVQRVYDRFVGAQLQLETTTLGQWEAYKNSMRRLEGVVNETSGYGLSKAMGEFWNAWNDLSNNPGGQAERVALTTKSQTLATTFQEFRDDMVRIQKDADFSIKMTIAEINTLSGQIAGLNDQIRNAEAVGQNANDYRDQRDQLVNQLTLLVDTSSYELDDGQVTVIMSSGKPLVEGNTSLTLSTAPDGNSLNDVLWQDYNGNSVVVTSQIAGGKIKGWLDVRDVAIPNYQGKLDTMAAGIINEVNALHAAGYGLVNLGTALPYTGVDFFTGTSADDMAVSATVQNDFKAISASSTQAGIPGDNGNAILIANLQTSLTLGGTPPTSTFDQYFSAMISELGSDVQAAENYHNHQQGMVTLLENNRESISGVSLDEEMVELVKFQHAYESAARLISIVDEMLDSLMQML